MARHENTLRRSIARVVKWAMNSGLSKSEIIRRGELNRGNLNALGTDQFNPTLAVYRGLLKAMPASKREQNILDGTMEWAAKVKAGEYEIARFTNLTGPAFVSRKKPNWNPWLSTVVELAKARDMMAHYPMESETDHAITSENIYD